ncbi:WD40 repeat-like protein [Dissoconium aciculare CBS 342.82]|uniref:WD40 repeat-like protein n=1 Tax=Dissoconium aciculare CBS 342.82 TaxID=1314786 RepID=A0A6J3LUB0_9PEZI|nr:WD40 repeat-like protein [Dissoconium aciculare CBS 342.82]KAF1818859.1 WD40 repeat-like protein [Dissoconium aciculare CBS 342.82]
MASHHNSHASHSANNNDSPTTFHHFPHGHQDLLLAAAYNFYGTRLATASADHKIKIWDRTPSNPQVPTTTSTDPSIPTISSSPATWTLTTTFPAHDAEVTGLCWNGPYTGEHLASIGEDGQVKIWAEDPTEPISSTRRFRRVWQQRSSTGVPFVGLGFKYSGVDTVLALTTRDGYLTVWEPNDDAGGGAGANAGGGEDDGDDLSSWKLWYEDHLCATPPRTEETAFRLCWHAEKLPPWPAILAGLDRRSIGFAVAVGNSVRIYRTDKERKFYVAATLEGAGGLVRDVAWANGSMRGFDLIATASRDGFVRIYELHTPATANASMTTTTAAANTDSASHHHHQQTSQPTLPSPQTPTFNTGGTTAVKPHHPPTTTRSSVLRSQLLGGRDGKRDPSSRGPGAILQEVKLIAELDAHEGAPWRVAWSPLGEILVSTGDDGVVRLWRRSVEGRWLESVEVDLTG